MSIGWELLMTLLNGLANFFLNPLLYLFLLFIYLHYRRQMIMERQLFSVRIQSPFVQTLRSIGMGLVGGLIASVLSCGLGMIVRIEDVWMLWVIAIVLAVIRLRFLCLAYATGVLTLLHIIAQFFPNLAQIQGIGQVWQWLLEVQPLPLLGLVAILHLVEALLVRWNAGRDASPLFIGGKRGRIIGAYQLHSFWLTPLFILVQMPAGTGVTGALFPGWPLFAPDSASFGLLLIPAVTGFSDLTQTMTARRKAKELSAQLALYSIVLLALTYAAAWVPLLSLLPALFAFAGHEALGVYSKWREEKLSPYFIQSSKGIKVMAVLPQTPAEVMGIRAGEIIIKVNGIPVREKEQLYPALQVNPAFCKMEVLTYDGEVKFVQCAIYAGNHHQLGIVVVPDATTQHFVDIRRASVVQLIKQRLQKLKIGA